MSIQKTLAKNLKLLRRKQAVSQEELAHLAGCHPTYLSALERGKANPTIDLLNKLAKALKVNFIDLFQ